MSVSKYGILTFFLSPQSPNIFAHIHEKIVQDKLILFLSNMNNYTSDITENTSLSIMSNLVLAKIVLNTIKSGQIKVTDHLPLFSIFESIAQSTHALSSNSKAIQCSRGDAMIRNSWAKYDSIGSSHDSS
jgi:DNA helicase TIP49 (TBP-interacting protein)